MTQIFFEIINVHAMYMANLSCLCVCHTQCTTKITVLRLIWLDVILLSI